MRKDNWIRVRFIRLRPKHIKCLLYLLIVSFLTLQVGSGAFSAPNPWFDTPDTDYAIVEGTSHIQLSPQYEPIKELIIRISKEYGVSPTLSLRVAKCESGLNPYAIGDRGYSRGLWQIHKTYHKEVTDQQAFDPEWSTRWALKHIKNGNDLWTCW